MKYNEKDDATNLFKELRNDPLRITDNHLIFLENFVLLVHYPKTIIFKSIDHDMMDALNATPNAQIIR